MKFAARQANLKMSEVDSIRAARKLGFEGVQLVIGLDYEKSGLWHERDARKVAEVAKSEGVEVCSLCAGTLNVSGFVAEDPGTRAIGQLVMEHALRSARILGCSNVLLPAFGKMAIQDAAGRERVAAEIKKLVPLAEDLGVIIAFECTLNAADTLAVVDATGSKLVQVYFDMANALYYGHDPIAEARALAPRIAEVHIKDGTRQAIVPLGEGQVDVAAVIRTLSQCGYDGYYAFETPLKGDVLQALARDLAYVKARL